MADPAATAGWLRARLAELPERARSDELRLQVASMIRDILGAGGSLVLAPDARMFEIGLGSLRLVELKRRLDDALQVDLPVTLFFQHATLSKLNTFLLTEALGAEAADVPAGSGEGARGPQPPADVDEIAGLSDEEAEARIAELLAETERETES